MYLPEIPVGDFAKMASNRTDERAHILATFKSQDAVQLELLVTLMADLLLEFQDIVLRIRLPKQIASDNMHLYRASPSLEIATYVYYEKYELQILYTEDMAHKSVNINISNDRSYGTLRSLRFTTLLEAIESFVEMWLDYCSPTGSYATTLQSWLDEQAAERVSHQQRAVAVLESLQGKIVSQLNALK